MSTSVQDTMDSHTTPTRAAYQSSRSQNTLKSALKEVVTIRPPEKASRSDSNQHLLSASPIIARENQTPPAAVKSTKSKSASKVNVEVKKASAALDLIDRLDATGIYGGGGFHRHDGPYAAASANRNKDKGTRAPMAAFVAPSSVSPSSSSARLSRPSNALSPLAQATLAAMDGNAALAQGQGEGPYIKSKRLGRRNSDSSISMGFPSHATAGKGGQLIEMFGFRDNEAWQDFGTTKYTAADGSNASSRESFQQPPSMGRGANGARTDSVWDIEATLKAGVPIGSSSGEAVAPAVSPSVSTDLDKPKRRKSMAARFLPGRKEGSEENGENGQQRNVDVVRRREVGPAINMNSESIGMDGYPGRDEDAASRVRFNAGSTPRSGAVSNSTTNHALGGPLAKSKSLGAETSSDGSKPLARRPSVMQRIFSKSNR